MLYELPKKNDLKVHINTWWTFCKICNQMKKRNFHYPFFFFQSIALAFHNINLEEWMTMKTKSNQKEEFVHLWSIGT